MELIIIKSKWLRVSNKFNMPFYPCTIPMCRMFSRMLSFGTHTRAMRVRIVAVCGRHCGDVCCCVFYLLFYFLKIDGCVQHVWLCQSLNIHMYKWFSLRPSIAFSLLLYLLHLFLVSSTVRNLVRFFHSAIKTRSTFPFISSFLFFTRTLSSIIWQWDASQRENQIINHVCEVSNVCRTHYMRRMKCGAHGRRRTVCVTTPSSNYIRFYLYIFCCWMFLNHFAKILLLRNQRTNERRIVSKRSSNWMMNIRRSNGRVDNNINDVLSARARVATQKMCNRRQGNARRQCVSSIALQLHACKLNCLRSRRRHDDPISFQFIAT